MRTCITCCLFLLQITFVQTKAQQNGAVQFASPYERTLQTQPVVKHTPSNKNAVTTVDSILYSAQNVSDRFITVIDHKIGTYSNRISNKTEQTLRKLSKWEGKIRQVLQRVSPETEQKLFGAGRMTFTTLLQQVREGKAVADDYRAKYDSYRDKIYSSIHYLDQHRDEIDKGKIQPLNRAKRKLDELEGNVSNSEAVESFIKERRKELVNEAIRYIGKSKYLEKIDREAWYYVETLRNYKSLFSEPKKAEETALNILNRIPAFKQFVQQNSMLASLFPQSGTAINAASLAGLQTRVNTQSLIQGRIAAGGPNVQAAITQNFGQAQAELSKLKDKILQAGGSGSTDEVPNFRPNMQKTKTFRQRLEYNTNIQFGKANSLLPATADIALSIGYKPNDKSVIGLGASYKLGFGRIDRLAISHQGMSLRSFIDWKLKKQFYVSGGVEFNLNAGFKNMEQLKEYNRWQTAGLVGISKRIEVKTRFFKGTKLQLMYDVFHKQHVPVSQPILFRVGYVWR
jgi:hypothetical protein